MLSTLYIEHSLLTQRLLPACSGDLPISTIWVLELQVGSQAHLPFSWVLGIPTLVLTASTSAAESFLQTLSTSFGKENHKDIIIIHSCIHLPDWNSRLPPASLKLPISMDFPRGRRENHKRQDPVTH